MEHFTQTASTTKQGNKRRLIIIVLAIAIGTAIWFQTKSKGTPANAATETSSESAASPAVPPVALEFSESDIARVEDRALTRTLSISGSLTTPTQAQVKAKVSGQILRVAVREGDAVERGQTLAVLDTADLKARLDAAVADQEERRARLNIAKVNRDNNLALMQRAFISKNAADQTESAYQAAEAALRWGQAQVRLAQNALSDATVVAPISGFVAKRQINGGEHVGPDTPLFDIVELSRLDLEASVPVADVPQLKIGQAVHFSVDGFGERKFSGQIDRINPVAEAGTRSIRVFARVPNPDGALRGGMFATGMIETGASPVGPIVPATALFEEAGQHYVFAIENGKLTKRAVTTGVEDEATGSVGIASGLAVGVPVVRVRMATLKEGAPATIKPAAPGAPLVASNAPS